MALPPAPVQGNAPLPSLSLPSTSPPASGTIVDVSGHALSNVPDFTFWINVALSAATLAVTCVGVVVAISAVVGYQAAKRMIKRQTLAQARESTNEYLKSDDFQEQLRAVASTVLKDHIKDRIVVSLAGPPAASTDGQRTELRGE